MVVRLVAAIVGVRLLFRSRKGLPLLAAERLYFLCSPTLLPAPVLLLLLRVLSVFSVHSRPIVYVPYSSK